MSACSFQGNWFPIEVIWAFFGLIAAGLLLPVLLAALFGGWREGPGRRALGAFKGAMVVLGLYGLIAGAVLAFVALDNARDRHDRAETAALTAHVEDVAPGGVAAALDAAGSASASTRRRYELAGALVGRLSERDDWTADDWQAVERFAGALRRSLAAGGMSAHHADTLDGLRLYAHFGPEQESEAKIACAGAQSCIEAVGEAAYRHDTRLIASVPETRVGTPAARLPRTVRAARERELIRLRLRDAGNPYGRESDLSLAWDRLEPGHLSAALAACVAGFPASRPASVYGRICIDDFAALLRAHGAERLCPAGQIDAADLELLQRWQAQAEADAQHGYLSAQSLAGLRTDWQGSCPSVRP